MRGSVLLFLLCTLACPHLHQCHQFFFMAAPNIIRVGSEETIIIQAHEFSGQTEVQITVQDFPKKRREFCNTSTKLAGPTHVAKAIIKVPTSFTDAALPGEKQYVIVQAMFTSVPNLNLEKIILVSPHYGYIYIQTDKPIYTPTQTVLYRIFTTDQKLDPQTRNVVVELQNPSGVTVTHDVRHVQNGLIANSINIPEIISFGTWKIVAKFQDAPQHEYVAQIEVAEYVLPTFDVQLTTDKKYFHLKDSEITIEIIARYVHNENVQGHAVATFGIVHNSRKMPLQNSWQRVDITDGKGSTTLTKAKLEESFENLANLVGSSIFVNVTVFSSGGDYVRAERSGITIVESPYRIQFIQTPQYFKPGMPFSFSVIVTNPDQSPAVGVPVSAVPDNVLHRTDKNGIVSLRVNSQGQVTTMQIKVMTKDNTLLESQQATISMTVTAYKSQLGNFLHTGVAKESQNLVVSLYTKHTNAGTKMSIKYFTLLLVSKGSIFKVIRQDQVTGADITTVTIEETPEMWPSFRIVTYYYLTSGASTEIVSDAVWVDMPDVCLGMLKIRKKENSPSEYRPGDIYNLELIADRDAKVGLVAVDKAVYVLNKKNKLSQKKVWETVDKNDIGCTTGSGKDSMGVFQDAGIDIATSLNIATIARTALNCPPPPTRKRRSVKLIELKINKVSKYTGELRDCCEAGIRENPMGFSCEQRKAHVSQGKECAEAFLDCCSFAETLQPEEKEELIWSRNDEEDIDEEEEDELQRSTTLRSSFPETWLWNVFDIKDDTKKPSGASVLTLPLKSAHLPDSITTWELMAVSINKDKGICVSEPLELIVKKEFFVDLRLPFSAVRNEQVEIRAVLYNSLSETLQVRVTFQYNEKLCSAATRSRAYRETISVKAHTTVAVPYIVVPLDLGKIEIEVMAAVMRQFVADGVRKSFNVVAEGQIVRVPKSILLDPRGKSQVEVIPSVHFHELVPDTDPQTFISIQGDILGETLLGSLNSDLKSLISLPGGCPEQNMIGTSPNVILAKYLDDTRQWDQIGVEHRNKVIENIVNGYRHQVIRNRNNDHSYASTAWLTAYVVKIFAMASELVNVDTDSLCKSVGWLLLKAQTLDGAFHEGGRVFTSALQGGYKESEVDASLTAFVLIALKESEKICEPHIKVLVSRMQDAMRYLERRLPSLRMPYSAVITSYVLALMKSPKANDVMDGFSHNKTYWTVANDPMSLYTVEATAYALLQKLELKKFDEAHKVAEWLIGRRDYGGGYYSTQPTVVALQALAQYKKDIRENINTNLNVVLQVSGRAQPSTWTIDQFNAYRERSETVPANRELSINATGSGKGTLTVLTVYHSLQVEQECKDFHLSASLEPVNTGSRHDARETFKLTITARYRGAQSATMTIIDVKMLTAFLPEEKDLKLLMNGIENYISQYESMTTANNGSVIIYLNEVSNTQDLVLSFRVHQALRVGLLQPAALTIYEYYDPAKRCTKFYNIPEQSGMIRKLCMRSVCKCAEGNCAVQQDVVQQVTRKGLNDAACATSVDYAFKVRLINTTKYDSDMYDRHTVKIEDIIKPGTDSAALSGHERTFISHVACRDSLKLEETEEYLIMGQATDMWQNKTGSWAYILGTKTYILQWLEAQKVKSAQFNTLGEMLLDFSTDLKTNGCQT